MLHTESYKDYTIEINYDDNAVSPRHWDATGRIYAVGLDSCLNNNDVKLDRRSSIEEVIFQICMDYKHLYTDEEDKEYLRLNGFWDREKLSSRYYEDYLKEALKGKKSFAEVRREFLFDMMERDLIEDIVFPEALNYKKIYKYEHGGVILNTYGFSCPWDSGCIGFIVTTENGEEIEKILENEIKLLSEYIQGYILSYTIKKDDEVIDSCGDMYESTEELLKLVKSEIDILEK